MNEQAIAIFHICDEVVKPYGFSENPNYKMTTAKVMTFVIISALHYQADYNATRLTVFSSIIRRIPRYTQEHSKIGISALAKPKC